jgi:hypothetical protein
MWKGTAATLNPRPAMIKVRPISVAKLKPSVPSSKPAAISLYEVLLAGLNLVHPDASRAS